MMTTLGNSFSDWSFKYLQTKHEHSFCSSSPLQSAGVMSVYLFMKRYTAEELYRPHPGFYHPRLSNCSDYSGQFLHPDAWVRGRSPSDISSDASLQMNSNYPALLKCPDYDQMSSSPCWMASVDPHFGSEWKAGGGCNVLSLYFKKGHFARTAPFHLYN